MKNEQNNRNPQGKLIPVDFDPFAYGDLYMTAPSTEAQKEVWVSSQMGYSASCAYNESISVHLHGPLDVESLRSAMSELIQRHDALRTTFSPDGKTLCIATSGEIVVPVIDLSGVGKSTSEKQLSGLLKDDSKTTFNLEKGPLFRVKIVKLQEKKHIVILTAHYIICDGWSMDVLLHDLSVLYSAITQGVKANLKEPHRFSEYAIMQAKQAQSNESNEAVGYWLKQLSGKIPVLNLPFNKPQPRTRSFNGALEVLEIDTPIVSDLKRVAVEFGCSIFSTLLAGFYVLLYRISGQEDLIVGIPAAGQLLTGKNDLVGHCVNVLPLRSHINGEQEFSQYLRSLKTKMLDAYDHNQCTSGSLQEKISFSHDPNWIQLVSVFVTNTHKYKREEIIFDGLDIDYFLNPRYFETYEINMNLYECADKIILKCHYNTDRFSISSIRYMLEQFNELLIGISRDPEKKISQLPIRTLRGKQAKAEKSPKEYWKIEKYPNQSQRRKDAVAEVKDSPQRSKRPFRRVIPIGEERENTITGLRNRLLQLLARIVPGATSLRVFLHRLRGVKIGEGIWIGCDAIIETSRPDLVTIGNRVVIGIRSNIFAHFHESEGVRIEDDVYIGPCAIILPNVTIGRGAVIAAGSVISVSVPPMTLVQGNPARSIAKCGTSLGLFTSGKEFLNSLKPL